MQRERSRTSAGFRASVIERTVAGVLQIALAVTVAPWQLFLFGILEIVSAGWTTLALSATGEDA